MQLHDGSLRMTGQPRERRRADLPTPDQYHPTENPYLLGLHVTLTMWVVLMAVATATESSYLAFISAPLLILQGAVGRLLARIFPAGVPGLVHTLSWLVMAAAVTYIAIAIATRF